jgi:hypothetical protein
VLGLKIDIVDMTVCMLDSGSVGTAGETENGSCLESNQGVACGFLHLLDCAEVDCISVFCFLKSCEWNVDVLECC